MGERGAGRMPGPPLPAALRRRQLIMFGFVGGTAFLVDNGIWYSLKLTILIEKPTTAKAIGILVATIVSYVLNREWSFRNRGGRERRHEAALYFFFSGIAIAINLVPLLVSRYALDLEQPHVSFLTQEFADIVSGAIIGMLLAMAFRYWAFKKWVFPDEFGWPELRRPAETA